MCMFLTVLYAGFSALVFIYTNALLDEDRADAREEALRPSDPDPAPGYIGINRFGVTGSKNTNRTSGFVSPHDDPNLT